MFHQAVSRLYVARFISLLLLPLVFAAAAGAAVTLEWDPNDPSPEGYRLFRRLDGEAYDYSAPLGAVTGTRFIDDTTTAGETYHYVVRAFDGEDESGNSNEVSYTAPADGGSDHTGSSPGGDAGDDPATNGGGGDTADDTDAQDTPDTVSDQETPVDPIGLTPLLSASMSVDGHRHAATRWQISLDEAFSSLVLDQVSGAQLTRYMVPDMVLDTETVYYWRATFLDDNDQVLVQSNRASFETLCASETDDADANGFLDNQEVDGNGLDLDGNGISDIEQDNLACVAAESGDGHVGLEVTTDNVQLVGLKSICPTQIANTRNLPEMTEFGAVSFKLFLQDGQDEATITIYFSEPAPEDTDWFKYSAELGWQLYDDAEFSADRRSVTYTLTDGGAGDDDGVVNGIIIDPAGLGYRQAADTDTDAPSAATGGSAGSGGSCFIAATAAGTDGVALAPIASALIAMMGGLALTLKRSR